MDYLRQLLRLIDKYNLYRQVLTKYLLCLGGHLLGVNNRIFLTCIRRRVSMEGLGIEAVVYDISPRAIRHLCIWPRGVRFLANVLDDYITITIPLTTILEIAGSNQTEE